MRTCSARAGMANTSAAAVTANTTFDNHRVFITTSDFGQATCNGQQTTVVHCCTHGTGDHDYKGQIGVRSCKKIVRRDFKQKTTAKVCLAVVYVIGSTNGTGEPPMPRCVILPWQGFRRRRTS